MRKNKEIFEKNYGNFCKNLEKLYNVENCWNNVEEFLKKLKKNVERSWNLDKKIRKFWNRDGNHWKISGNVGKTLENSGKNQKLF